MEFTEEQRRAIEAEGKVIVSASAGSGKTKIMIERILRLVLSGRAGVCDLIAVTFTKKAAFQMREKLRSALLDELKKSAGELRERLKGELDLLPLAEISTLHSFCGKIIRTYFYLLGDEVSPDYRILATEDAAALKSKALSSALEESFELSDENFRRLLETYYRGKRERALGAVVQRMYDCVRGYADGEELLKRAGEDRFDVAADYLAETFKQKAALLLKELLKLRPALSGNAAALKVIDSLSETIRRAEEAEGLYSILALDVTFLRMPNQPAEEGEEHRLWSTLKELNEAVKSLFKDAREKYGDEARERMRYREANGTAAALKTLVLNFAEKYAALKKDAGALDYNDLEHYALALLQKEEVRTEVKRKYRYVFVDEYQDVNPMQESILSLISGENVFLVGDEKQAIYGFRGSRSRYFREKKEEFGGALPLTENFRSASGILNVVNEIFSPVVPDYEPMRGGRLYQGHGGEIVSHKVVKKKDEQKIDGVYSVLKGRGASDRNALAEAVASVVESERGRLFFDIGSNSLRPVDYGDIAVLVRKDTTDGKRIARTLAACNIPVTSSSQVNVCDFYEVKLLVDCLKFLDNAEDDISMAACMLSSLGGFTDEDLMRIRIAYPAFPQFRKAVKAYAEEKTDELSHRLVVFFRKTRSRRALLKVRSAAQMVNLLLSEGLEAEIAAKEDGHSRLLRVRRLLAEAEKCADVHDFLVRLKENGDRIDFKETGGENAVRVMTMHASKGLEFPVVILASMETLLHDSDADEVEWSEKFLFSPRYYDCEKKTYCETISRYATKAERAKEEEEGERNLLYVGMTRAKYHLHLMVEDRKRAASFALFKRYSDYLGERFKGEAVEELLPMNVREAFDYESGESEKEKKEILAAMRIGGDYPFAKSVYLPEKSSATALLKSQESVHANAFGGATSEEGTAYHKFLQYFRFGQPVKVELERMKSAGVFSAEEESLLKAEQLEKIAALPCFLPLKDKRCEREKKFLLSLTPREFGGEDDGAEIIFQGAIDLLFEDRDGYVIYDYKYSGLSAEALKEKYAPQIMLYRLAVAKGKRVGKETVRAKIINILKGEEIGM